jgi:hypothetical protein
MLMQCADCKHQHLAQSADNKRVMQKFGLVFCDFLSAQKQQKTAVPLNNVGGTSCGGAGFSGL